MAITRTADTDDDGTGLTGTLHNNAWKQEIYDQIDASLTTIQTTTSTGTVNDFALTARDTFVRCNNASLLNITGFAAGFDGQQIEIVSIGAGQVDIANQNASSTAANRVITGVTGTISLAPGVGRARIVYDATTARWRVTHCIQGAFITPSYAGGTYTTSSAATWTVDSGDVQRLAWYLTGRKLTLIFDIETSSVSATSATELRIALPNSFVAAGRAWAVIRASDNGATAVAGYADCLATDTFVRCFKDLGGVTSWTTSTNTTALFGAIDVEIT